MSKYETLATIATIPTVRSDEVVVVRLQRNAITNELQVDLRVNYDGGSDKGWTKKGFSLDPEDLSSIVEVLSVINQAKEAANVG